MGTLFPLAVKADDVPDIPGLSYIPGYVTLQEEKDLAAAIDALPWDTSWDRRRQLYGASYGHQQEPAAEIPAWGRLLADRMHREALIERRFDQMLVNEYLPGQGIALHTDYEPFDRTVVSLSLLAPCVMDFQRIADGHRESWWQQPAG